MELEEGVMYSHDEVGSVIIVGYKNELMNKEDNNGVGGGALGFSKQKSTRHIY